MALWDDTDAVVRSLNEDLKAAGLGRLVYREHPGEGVILSVQVAAGPFTFVERYRL